MSVTIKKTTPEGKGVRTAIQAGVASALIALAISIWNVPGVPQVVEAWVVENFIQVILAVGVPSGLIAYVQNKAGK